MPEDSLNTKDRLAQLERRLRNQQRLAIAALLLVGLLILIGATPGDFGTIRGHRFIVEDDKGNPRALLTSTDGSVFLSMCDARGVQKLRLGVSARGESELSFLDDRQKRLLSLNESEGSVLVHMTEPKTRKTIRIGQIKEQFGIDVSNDGESPALRLRPGDSGPQIAAIDSQGTRIVQLFAQSDNAGFSVSRSDGVPNVIMTLPKSQKPLLLLQDDEKRTVVLPTRLKPVNSMFKTLFDGKPAVEPAD